MKHIVVLIFCSCFLSLAAYPQVSFYFDSLNGTAIFKSDVIYFYSGMTLAKGDYDGNLFWVKHITPGSKIEIGEDAIYGLSGLKVFKMDTAGNLIWTKKFITPINPASPDSNTIGDVLYDGSRIYLSTIQVPPQPWGAGPDIYPSIITLDTSGNVIQVSADHVQPGSGFFLQPGVRSLQGGAWIGYNYEPGFTHYSYLIKIDTSGNYNLTALCPSFFFSTVTYIRSITPLADSTYLVLAYSWDYNASIPQAFFTCSKLSSSGNILWQNSYWNTSFSCGLYVTDVSAAGCDSTGNIYLAGSASEQPCVGDPTGGTFLMKLNAQGDIIFIKSYNSSLIGIGLNGEIHYRNGNLYCNGSYNGRSAILVLDSLFTNSCFNPDSTLILNKVPSTIYTGPVTSTPPVISYVALSDTITVSTENIINSLDLCLTLNQAVTENIYNPIFLFPNPATGKLVLEIYEVAITQIEIFNLLGEKVFSITGNNLTTIDCSFLSPGIYIIQATSGEKTWRGKVVKE